MTKFIFKSNASDLQKISQSLETIQKNVLYSTYRIDSILKTLNKMATDKGLKQQVLDFYDDGNHEVSHPEDEKDLD